MFGEDFIMQILALIGLWKDFCYFDKHYTLKFTENFIGL